MASNERELCRYFLHGVCRYGENCFNSHDRNDKLSTVCRYYLQGCCLYGSECRYDHIKPRTSETNSTCSSFTHPIKSTNIKLDMDKIIKQTSTLSLSENSNYENEINNKYSTVSYANALTGCKDDTCVYNNDENESEFYLNLNQNLCPYFEKDGICLMDYECGYIHGDLCETCAKPCLHPNNDEQRRKHTEECMKKLEQEMEEAFAVQRSEDKQCGICMEIVWDKESHSDQRFGILENCNHIFCLPCIRKWRASKSYENKIVKACPECRVKSNFVTPSRYWFEDETNKKKIIEDYKIKLQKTECKYFKKGAGKCPFGNKCFYLHQYPDGRLADLPSPNPRRRINRNGLLESFSNLIRVDFEYWDADDFDDDGDIDILSFIRHNFIAESGDTDSDFSDSILELFEDYF